MVIKFPVGLSYDLSGRILQQQRWLYCVKDFPSHTPVEFSSFLLQIISANNCENVRLTVYIHDDQPHHVHNMIYIYIGDTHRAQLEELVVALHQHCFAVTSQHVVGHSICGGPYEILYSQEHELRRQFWAASLLHLGGDLIILRTIRGVAQNYDDQRRSLLDLVPVYSTRFHINFWYWSRVFFPGVLILTNRLSVTPNGSWESRYVFLVITLQ